MAQRYSADEVITAIEKASGIIKNAAKLLGCSRQTVYNYINNYATVKQAYDDANENMVDYVESKLIEQISVGNTTAIIFYLKTKGKHRGYTERTEHTGADGGAMEFKLVYPDD